MIRRICRSAVLLLPLIGFGVGCNGQGHPKSDKPALLPAGGPPSLQGNAPPLPPPPPSIRS